MLIKHKKSLCNTRWESLTQMYMAKTVYYVLHGKTVLEIALSEIPMGLSSVLVVSQGTVLLSSHYEHFIYFIFFFTK